MSGDENTGGLILDLLPDAGPSKPAWGSLKEVGGLWGLLRFLPGAFRQAFSGEPVGGLPVVEPGQERPGGLQEIDFNSGAPIGTHTPVAETEAAETVAAETPTVEPVGAELGAEDALAGQATTAEAVVAEPPEGALVAAEAIHVQGAEPVAADVIEAAGEVTASTDAAGVSVCGGPVAVADAELGEAGLEAGL